MERYRRPNAIRAELLTRWPATSWSVRVSGGSGSLTLTTISWEGAPSAEEVMAVAYEHEGRRQVRLRHTDSPGAPPESPSPVLRGGHPAVATPIPYDDETCATCGGALTTVAGELVHVGTQLLACACATCGVPRRDVVVVDDVVQCGQCAQGIPTHHVHVEGVGYVNVYEADRLAAAEADELAAAGG